MTGTRKGEEVKPIAWTIPGDDNADMNGFIPTKIYKEGEFTKPLYATPSPVGVDVMREALEKIAAEQKVYRGHGDYDIIPALDADEAQAVARTALASAPQSVAAKLDHEIEQDFALIKEALRIADEDRDIDTAQAEDALERISFIVAEAGWSAPAPSPSAGGEPSSLSADSQSSLDEETIEAAARVCPEMSETFSYQAAGYADGWWACIEAYRKAIRALKSKPSPQVGRGILLGCQKLAAVQASEAEEAQCAHLVLDDMGVPRADNHGAIYSLVGRIKKAVAPAPPSVEGWKLVPVEPTEAMIEAHFAAHAKARTVFASVPEIWKAMLSAAPKLSEVK